MATLEALHPVGRRASSCPACRRRVHTVCNAINKPLTVKNEATVPASSDAAAVSSSRATRERWNRARTSSNDALSTREIYVTLVALARVTDSRVASVGPRDSRARWFVWYVYDESRPVNESPSPTHPRLTSVAALGDDSRDERDGDDARARDSSVQVRRTTRDESWTTATNRGRRRGAIRGRGRDPTRPDRARWARRLTRG